jgi:hypothetical protein
VSRRCRASALVAGVVWLGSGVAAQQPAPTVADLLARAGSYLAEYEAQFSAVVSAEHYVQRTSRGRASTTVLLQSDVIWLNVGQDAWIAFRDVFDVDGQAVRDHDQRLEKLFLQSPDQAMVQAKAIMDESARYNVGSVRRNINVPTMALAYLRGVNQARSTFKRQGREIIEGTQAAVLAFKEQAKPTVIRSFTRDLPVTGRFWIDETSGRVLKSELDASLGNITAKIVVTYRAAPNLEIWTPAVMSEKYTATGAETITGEATYSNFRQFAVKVGSSIK